MGAGSLHAFRLSPCTFFDRAAELAGAAGNVAGLLEHEGY